MKTKEFKQRAKEEYLRYMMLYETVQGIVNCLENCWKIEPVPDFNDDRRPGRFVYINDKENGRTFYMKYEEGDHSRIEAVASWPINPVDKRAWWPSDCDTKGKRLRITATLSKSPQAIANDIQRKLITDCNSIWTMAHEYIKQDEKADKQERDFVQKIRGMNELLNRVRVFGKDEPGQRARRDTSISIDSLGEGSYATISRLSGGTAYIQMYSAPYDLVVRLCKTIAAFDDECQERKNRKE